MALLPASCCPACLKVREAADRYSRSKGYQVHGLLADLRDALAAPCSGPTALPEEPSHPAVEAAWIADDEQLSVERVRWMLRAAYAAERRAAPSND